MALLVPRQATFALAMTLRRRGRVTCPNLNFVGHSGQVRAERGLQAAVSAEVPGEEPQCAVYLECRDIPVLAGVGVQRLLG